MNLLGKFLIVLTLGVGSQDSVKVDCPFKTNRDSKKCIIKQDQMHLLAQKVNAKLDSIHAKFDRRMDEIMKLLDENKD